MMRAFVTELPLAEPARFDPLRLEDMCHRLGETRAETELAHALRRIGTHLEAILPAARAGAVTTLNGVLHRLRNDADLIGMATLARVATDVQSCLIAGDSAAFAATLARLERVGARSIHAAWDLEDSSG